MTKRDSHVPPGGGQSTLMDDTPNVPFALGLHLRRHHAKTLYGLDCDGISARLGTSHHVPADVPQACTTEGRDARTLLISPPPGFDRVMSDRTETNFADTAKMTTLNNTYTTVPLGGVPDRP